MVLFNKANVSRLTNSVYLTLLGRKIPSNLISPDMVQETMTHV